MTRHLLSALALTISLLLGWEVCADSTAPPSAERVFEAVRMSPPRLRVFLQAMPKGGELHTHLWGVPSAEDFLGWAAEDKLCFDVPTLSLAAPPCAQPSAPAVAGLAAHDPALYVTALDALSLRGQNAGVGTQLRSGHDQFFMTFGRFALVASHEPGRMLALARSLAAGDHVDYLELQSDPAAFVEAGRRHVPAGWRRTLRRAKRRWHPLSRPCSPAPARKPTRWRRRRCGVLAASSAKRRRRAG